jgi:pimeloyl-ACP methyl ester carboxylesterase
MLHTVRTQAEQFRRVIPLVQSHYTIYALDLPGMGYSEIVPGASYDEPALRAGVKRLITALDLGDVTLLGESIGAVLALTTAADHPDRIRQVIAVNPYDYRGGIKRSGLLARAIVSGVIAPGVGPRLAKLEPKPVMRSILRDGLVDKTALSEDYLDELLNVGQRPGYPTVARAIYRNLPTMIAARDRYSAIKAPCISSTAHRTGRGAPIAKPTNENSPTPTTPRSQTQGTSSPWNAPTCPPTYSPH